MVSAIEQAKKDLKKIFSFLGAIALAVYFLSISGFPINRLNEYALLILYAVGLF